LEWKLAPQFVSFPDNDEVEVEKRVSQQDGALEIGGGGQHGSGLWGASPEQGLEVVGQCRDALPDGVGIRKAIRGAGVDILERAKQTNLAKEHKTPFKVGTGEGRITVGAARQSVERTNRTDGKP